MILNFVNRLIRKLGRENYAVDQHIKGVNICIILKDKFFELIRGSYIRIFLKKSEGIVFAGKRVTIKHCNKIRVGRTLFLGDNVSINALSKQGIQFGDNVSIHRNTIIDCTGAIRTLGEGLIVGNNVGFSPNCFIQVRGIVKIGNNVIFGPGVSIFSETHNHADSDVFINEQGETRVGVTIEDGVWIGSAATILDGVTIGRNSIIAAKSLVNKNVPPYSIAAGNPAKIIRSRDEANAFKA